MDVGAVDLAQLDGSHHEVLAALRAVSPVMWVPALNGWLVTSREHAVAVMRDPRTFTVDDPRFSTAQVVGPSMLSLDGPEHERHRSPFAEPLRPADANARYGTRITELAEGLVRDLAPRGAAELRRALAGPLAVAVATLVLGLDGLAPADLLATYDSIVAAVDAVSRGEAVTTEARAAVDGLAAQLRVSMRREGTLVHDVALRLDPAEVVSNSAVFLFGAIETSEGMTANVLHHLLADPAQWSQVQHDRNLVDTAVEESLRLEPAAARVDRYATADVVLAGTRIAEGDLVVVSLAGANRDPAVYPDPDRFDLARPNVRSHVAFAQGPHTCLGAQLARLQARAAVHSVLDHLPGIELAAPATVGGVIFRKPASLQVRWDAGR